MGIETKKHEPIVYRVYDEIKGHIGRPNAIGGKELSAKFDITERHLREIVHEIRADEMLTHLILSCNRGYYVPTVDEGAKDINRLYSQAFSLLKIARVQERKAGLNNQYKLRLGEYYQEFVRAYGDNE